MAALRTFLILGRVSNLPTVWSNCVAGWWLGGGGNTGKLPLLFVGASLLYLGGMFLNDAFDEGFDLQYRRERPIPSGAISAQTVWLMGFSMLAAGLICAFAAGRTTGILAILMIGCILVYDAIHKLITVSPVIMAGCRFLLYLMAASVASAGVSGSAIWCGLALGAYVVGLSYVAAKESTGAALRYWPCLFLAAPVILAFFMNTGSYLKNALLLSVVLGLWVVRHLRYSFGSADRNVGRTVSGLLAGIVLVDFLAAPDLPKLLALVYVGLFLLALLLQRFVPAT